MTIENVHIQRNAPNCHIPGEILNCEYEINSLVLIAEFWPNMGWVAGIEIFVFKFDFQEFQ